jgi:electron transport complex protein RnfG
MGTPREPQYRKRVGYQAALLGGFATIATALLVAANLATRDAIELRQQEDLRDILKEVVPAGYYSNDLLAHPLQLPVGSEHSLTVYRGIKGLRVSALVWEVRGRGYAGDIRLILGVDADGQVLGVRVLSHAETPGLGDKIELAKDDWILSFNGLSLGAPPAEQWRVKKDGGQFDAFSGATITPRAVVDAVRQALEMYRQRRSELLVPVEIISTQGE